MRHQRLQHSYYDITRIDKYELPKHLITKGVFIDLENLDPKVPSVVREMNSKRNEVCIAKEDEKEVDIVELNKLKTQTEKVNVENDGNEVCIAKEDEKEVDIVELNKLKTQIEKVNIENDGLKLENKKLCSSNAEKDRLKLDNDRMKLEIEKLNSSNAENDRLKLDNDRLKLDNDRMKLEIEKVKNSHSSCCSIS